MSPSEMSPLGPFRVLWFFTLGAQRPQEVGWDFGANRQAPRQTTKGSTESVGLAMTNTTGSARRLLTGKCQTKPQTQRAILDTQNRTLFKSQRRSSIVLCAPHFEGFDSHWINHHVIQCDMHGLTSRWNQDRLRQPSFLRQVCNYDTIGDKNTT